MDKTALKNFAVNSRNKLIEDTIYKLSLIGITENEIQTPVKSEGIESFQIGGTTFSIYDEDIEKRSEIIKQIKNKGLNTFVEEVSYYLMERRI